jgi:hypothetical protein
MVALDSSGGFIVTFSDLASIGSFVSGLAVLVSLVYLSLQIRQNTLAHRATAYASRQQYAKEQIQMLMDPTFASLQLRMSQGDETLSEVECYQFYLMYNLFLVGMDHLVWLHDNNILDEETYQVQVRVLTQRLAPPAGRAAWELWKPLSTPAFRKLVEQQLALVAPRPIPRFGERWKAAMEDARAASSAASASGNVE